jgi:hypothetical protein
VLRRPLLSGVLLACPLFILACTDGEEPTARPPEPRSDLTFTDVTEDSGLGAFVQTNGSAEKPFIVETVGGGVALFDCDDDGDLDAYLTNGGYLENAPAESTPADALYVNDGSGSFSDGTERAGLGDTNWTNGVRVVDLDGDGLPDLYLTNYGPNVLYRNVGDGRFEDVTDASGLADPRWSTGASFLDHDRDGDLDLYVANYVEFDREEMLRERPQIMHLGVSVMKGPRGLKPSADAFFLNEGGWRFRDASLETGVGEPRRFGFQVVAFDSDRDGWVDVYVANDSVANLLWRNVDGERFEDRAVLAGLAFSMAGKPQAGMGIGVGDFDGDLQVDLFVTNFSDDYFTLYRGSGDGFFVDVTKRANLGLVTKAMLGWGCGFADFDNDGAAELFAVNGHVYPQVEEFDLGLDYQQRNQLFELRGTQFHEPEGAGGPGFALLRSSRGAAVGDVDADGDLDLLIGNIDQSPTLLRNDSQTENSLRVRLVGQGANRDALGARVVARIGDHAQLRIVGAGSSFLSSSELVLHFGTGEAERVDELEVTWPDGTVQLVTDLACGQVVTIER